MEIQRPPVPLFGVDISFCTIMKWCWICNIAFQVNYIFIDNKWCYNVVMILAISLNICDTIQLG